MKSPRPSMCHDARRGVTLIQVLVVIFIIALLAALVAPAVVTSRITSRKFDCMNNMRQVGIALISYSSATDGRLPYLTSDLQISNSNGNGMMYGTGWPMAILPALDASAVLKNIKANAQNEETLNGTSSFSVNGTRNATAGGEDIWLPVLTCPEDTDSFRRPGGLSYVVNAGAMPSRLWGCCETPELFAEGVFLQPYSLDWNNDGNVSLNGITLPSPFTTFDAEDQAFALATGVFFRPTAGAGSNSVQPSLDHVAAGDGTSTTILVTENLNAGPWNGSLGSQAGFGVNQLGFGIGLPPRSSSNVNAVSASAISPGTLNPILGKFDDPSVTPDNWVINRNKATATIGSAPRPSSQHVGGVNVIMCDGSGRFINDQIDIRVYWKLMTSNGVSFGETTLSTGGTY